MYQFLTVGLIAFGAAGLVAAQDSSASFSGTTVTAGIIYTPGGLSTSASSTVTVSEDGTAVTTIPSATNSETTTVAETSNAGSALSSSAASAASTSSHNAAATPNAGSLAGVIALGVMAVAL